MYEELCLCIPPLTVFVNLLRSHSHLISEAIQGAHRFYFTCNTPAVFKGRVGRRERPKRKTRATQV